MRDGETLRLTAIMLYFFDRIIVPLGPFGRGYDGDVTTKDVFDEHVGFFCWIIYQYVHGICT